MRYLPNCIKTPLRHTTEGCLNDFVDLPLGPLRFSPRSAFALGTAASTPCNSLARYRCDALRGSFAGGNLSVRGDRGADFAFLLGFTRPDTPCKASLSNLLRRLDIQRFEAALAAWITAASGDRPLGRIAIDGKTLRGAADGSSPGVHLLAAYAAEHGAVLTQLRVDCKTNEHKAALEMLRILPLTGVVVTADAMFTHRDFAQEVLGRGGDYILPLKDNQPTLRAEVALAFTTPEGLSPPAAARA